MVCVPDAGLGTLHILSHRISVTTILPPLYRQEKVRLGHEPRQAGSQVHHASEQCTAQLAGKERAPTLILRFSPPPGFQKPLSFRFLRLEIGLLLQSWSHGLHDPGAHLSKAFTRPRSFLLLRQLMSTWVLFLTDCVSTESGPVLNSSSSRFCSSSGVISLLGLLRRLLNKQVGSHR